jgi:TolB-like protein
VFLTPHGLKLLDFGLARAMPTNSGETVTNVTAHGVVVGTPNYMAPEQVLGQAVDGRADLFAVGSILFEMLIGKPPFDRKLAVQVFHAIIAEEPAALGGAPAVHAIDRIIRRALSKTPDARYRTADAMAHDLRETLLAADPVRVSAARPMTRLIVLPFRVLRADATIEFLAFSVPDAVTNALSGLDSLVVRSSAVASRFTDPGLDVKALGVATDVDVVLTGTLMRAGDQLRVSSQLVAVTDARVIWSQATQVPMGDLFALQDQLASQIVESLALPLTTREHRLLKHDVPASAKAYEFYLHGNQALAQYAFATARDLFLQSLDHDRRYAPTWAGLGAAYRSLGKFGVAEADELLGRSESAFRTALELNPDLSRAHNLYARLKIDLGNAQGAMLGLLERTRIRRNDPDLFAGLVQACRYCGLLDASIAADQKARRVDQHIRTSVVHTYIMKGEYQRALDVTADDPADPVTMSIILLMLDRLDDAVRVLESARSWDAPLMPRRWADSLRFLAQRRPSDALVVLNEVMSGSHRDPETSYYGARQLAFLGNRPAALDLLQRAIEGGFHCATALQSDPWFDALRPDGRFTEMVHTAETRAQQSRAAFLEAGGDDLFRILAK